METPQQRKALRHRVRRRLIRAVSDLHPEVELVRVKSWVGADAEVGRRWMADERSQGKGTHDAYLVVVKRPRPREEKADEGLGAGPGATETR